MAAGEQILSNLRRTMLSIFRIGDINVKDNSGIVETRNAADSAYADVGVNQVRVHGDNATNFVGLDAPGALGSSPVFVLPAADGSSGQFMQTNGSGVLTFADSTSNGDLVQIESFTEATSSPLTIFTPPANARITKVAIHLSAAAASSGSSLTVTDSSIDFMEAADIDMQTTGTYIVFPLDNNDVGGTPTAIELTITAGGQTFSGDVYVHYSTPG